MKEIVNYYGGRVDFSKGVTYSTSANDLNGKYLEIKLNSPGIGRHFDELELPASNCAYLAYHNLTPAERGKYDYYKVEVSDSATSHTYVFKTPDMGRVSQAHQMGETVLTDLRDHNYSGIISACNRTAFDSLNSDTLQHVFTRLSGQLIPFKTFAIQGYMPVIDKISGQRHRFMLLVATVPSAKPATTHLVTVLVDPQYKLTEKFLYGLNMRDMRD